MCHEKDRQPALLVQPLKRVQNLHTRPRVQIAGGLIRQQDRRIVDQRAGYGHALLLSAGKLRGVVIGAFFQAQQAKRLESPPGALLALHARIDQRQFHIFVSRRAGQQIESLKDKSDFLVANARQLVFGKLRDVLPIQAI